MAWVREHSRGLLVGALAAVFLWQWVITWGDPRDFGVYYAAGARVLSGASLYDYADPTALSYKYSPAFAFLFVPFALLPIEVARSLWFLVNLGLTLALTPLAFAALGRTGDQRHRTIVYAAATLLCLRYATMSAASGQVVALQLALILGGLVLVERNREAAGAPLLGLAILVKLSPMLLLGYLALRRRWRALFLTCAVTGAWALVPALRYGVTGNIALHLRWLAFIQDGNTLHQLTRHQNQSLPSLLARVLNANGWPLASITPLLAPILFGGFAVLMLVLWRWTTTDERQRVALPAILGWMTLSSPLAWRYNFLALLPAWVYLADRVLRGQRTGNTIPLAIAALAASVLFTRDIIGRAGEAWTHALGIEAWGAVLLLVACVDLARAAQRTDADPLVSEPWRSLRPTGRTRTMMVSPPGSAPLRSPTSRIP